MSLAIVTKLFKITKNQHIHESLLWLRKPVCSGCVNSIPLIKQNIYSAKYWQICEISYIYFQGPLSVCRKQPPRFSNNRIMYIIMHFQFITVMQVDAFALFWFRTKTKCFSRFLTRSQFSFQHLVLYFLLLNAF